MNPALEAGQRSSVELALTPSPELLWVVQGLTKVVAEQAGLAESQRLNVAQGVERACRRLMPAGAHEKRATIRLRFAGFADRLEVVLEDGGRAVEPIETDSFLLTQLLDRVSVEELGGGRLRLTLIKYLSPTRSGP